MPWRDDDDVFNCTLYIGSTPLKKENSTRRYREKSRY